MENRQEVDFQIGEDLYGVSIEELQTRILVLETEISRLQDELIKKKSERSAADSLFKK